MQLGITFGVGPIHAGIVFHLSWKVALCLLLLAFWFDWFYTAGDFFRETAKDVVDGWVYRYTISVKKSPAPLGDAKSVSLGSVEAGW